ncbi:MAG: signal peptidase I [Candidatus Shapirobacteria bacterium]|nr:signal peptidase I [Candidatus Shapirobacteria bacterium]MDD5073735.1 signal peptidase I [Candidatus Shapirobacteria bacterium]MDD5481660.1 signal peptidase I [Candidatus Shapirobacteria bacterium]
MAKKVWRLFLEIIQDITLVLAAFVLVYLFLFRPHQVNGMSMYPSFHDKDFILSERISYRFREPKRGEIVVFKAPPTEVCAAIECEYIKRVVALSGEAVKVKDGTVFINGQPLVEEYLPDETVTSAGDFLHEDEEKVVPQDYFLFLGDNRGGSRDGRDFGFIAKEDIVGRAIFRYWPLLGFGSVANVGF